MHISIDTNEALTTVDVRILTLLVNGSAVDEEAERVEAPAPAKKAESQKPTKKAKKPEPEPEPEPEPMAEEELEEPEVEDESEEDEEQSDEDLLDLAVKKATEMVAGGEAAKVREALDAAGASRVRELNKDNVREFFKALS